MNEEYQKSFHKTKEKLRETPEERQFEFRWELWMRSTRSHFIRLRKNYGRLLKKDSLSSGKNCHDKHFGNIGCNNNNMMIIVWLWIFDHEKQNSQLEIFSCLLSQQSLSTDWANLWEFLVLILDVNGVRTRSYEFWGLYCPPCLVLVHSEPWCK